VTSIVSPPWQAPRYAKEKRLRRDRPVYIARICPPDAGYARARGTGRVCGALPELCKQS